MTLTGPRGLLLSLLCGSSLLLVPGCGGSSNATSGDGGTMNTDGGTMGAKAQYPDISSLAQKVVPRVSSSSTMRSSFGRPVPYAATVTYAGTASDWTAALPYFDEVLGPNDGGPDTRIAIQLANVQKDIDNINQRYLDANGNPMGCTKTLTASSTVKTPFFSDTSSAPIFWASQISDTGKYQCYVQTGTSSAVVFGRSAITNPPAGCTDPNQYFIIDGRSQSNTDGTKVHEIARIAYDGCATNVAVAMALTSQYPSSKTSDGEFSARFEFAGNTASGRFQMRIAKLDTVGVAGSSNFGVDQYVGAGVAQVSTGSNHLILARNPLACPTGAASCMTANGQTASTWCLTVTPGSTTPTYAVDTTTSDCASNETDFAGLTPLTAADVGRTFIDFSTSTPFGL